MSLTVLGRVPSYTLCLNTMTPVDLECFDLAVLRQTKDAIWNGIKGLALRVDSAFSRLFSISAVNAEEPTPSFQQQIEEQERAASLDIQNAERYLQQLNRSSFSNSDLLPLKNLSLIQPLPPIPPIPPLPPSPSVPPFEPDPAMVATLATLDHNGHGCSLLACQIAADIQNLKTALLSPQRLEHQDNITCSLESVRDYTMSAENQGHDFCFPIYRTFIDLISSLRHYLTSPSHFRLIDEIFTLMLAIEHLPTIQKEQLAVKIVNFVTPNIETLAAYDSHFLDLLILLEKKHPQCPYVVEQVLKAVEKLVENKQGSSHIDAFQKLLTEYHAKGKTTFAGSRNTIWQMYRKSPWTFGLFGAAFGVAISALCVRLLKQARQNRAPKPNPNKSTTAKDPKSPHATEKPPNSAKKN